MRLLKQAREQGGSSLKRQSDDALIKRYLNPTVLKVTDYSVLQWNI